jgi:WD40 repeat protein
MVSSQLHPQGDPNLTEMPKPDERDIFDAARRIVSPDARRLYLYRACEDDDDLLARVEALLQVHEEDVGFLRFPAVPPAASAVLEVRGCRIGPYKLIEAIGEGGFGVVFLAEQRHPLRRVVALKIVKPGMDTREVLARFEAERQALAMMEHPNIARVFDGGTTESGRPFFVMELVKGVPITRYCDEHQLTPRDRLTLMEQVCRAVQHAHQKGVIHRDLKPTNVLVAAYDGRPVPKIIDFGVAKALGERLTERTLVTSFGGIVGTLEYMSPEQAEFNARDVDTRADIYSLGVLLYELLTGTTPLSRERLKRTAINEVLRLIREEDPPKPSTCLSERHRSLAAVSAQRRLQNERLTHHLRGELDWIVMRALEKNRERRYQTASGLARDIERYLSGEPVEACPPSRRYRLRKFAYKNRKLLGAALAFALVLVVATAVSGWLALRATLAERTAQRHVYVAHMNLAQSDWEENRLERLVSLLDEHLPRPNEDDLRGFEWYYWRRLVDTPLLTLRGHDGLVPCAIFSPDGKSIASASHDFTAKLWDAEDGSELRTFSGHQDFVLGIAFSPDGRRLATASRDGTIRIWDVATGEPARTLKGHTAWVTSIVFSTDGRLASAAQDGVVKFWDAVEGLPLRSVQSSQGAVFGLAFSPDGKWLASAGQDHSIKIWDVETASTARRLTGHTHQVHRVAFSPDGRWLASAGMDSTARLWDAATGSEQRALKGHADRVFAVTFSPDGKLLASASADQTIRFWDVASGSQLATLKGHTHWVHSVAFSPDGERLASAGSDRTIRVWNVAAGQETMFEMRGNTSKAILRVAFSPDGTRLAAAGSDPSIKIWDAASGLKMLTLAGHSTFVRDIAFRPDGARLASASDDHTVRIWHAQTGRTLMTLKAADGSFFAVAFSPDGRRLATAGDDKTVRLWDAASGRETMAFRGHEGTVTGLAFSANGRWLASSGLDESIRIWDLRRGQEARTLMGHRGDVARLAFSRDGTKLASAGKDHLVRVWDTATGRGLAALSGHVDYVHGVAFSPDGNRLASASADRTVKLWDLTSAQETLTLKGHSTLVLDVAFSPDGGRLASSDLTGTVLLWDARPWTSALRAESEARNQCRLLFAEVGLKSEVMERIERETGLTPAVRNEVRRIADLWEEDPRDLTEKSLRVTLRRSQPPERYALALRQAQVACRLDPDNLAARRALGAALYRNGQYAEAVETLTRCDHETGQQGRHNPIDAALLALSCFWQGQIDEARGWLSKFPSVKVGRPQAKEGDGFMQEAIRLFEGQ